MQEDVAMGAWGIIGSIFAVVIFLGVGFGLMAAGALDEFFKSKPKLPKQKRPSLSAEP